MSAQITEQFDGTGSLGANWSASSDLVRLNGNLHTNATVTSTKSIGVWNVQSNINEVSINWAASGDGCEGDGPEWGGVIFMNSANHTGNGYFINYYSGKIKLSGVSNNVYTSTLSELNATPAPTPGSIFMVKLNPATWSFEVLLNGTSLGTLSDPAGGPRYNMTTSYGGVMLFGGKANDIESVTFKYTPPSTDTTPPAAPTLSVGTITSSSVQLSWTAPGDDGTGGGAALEYDLRVSTATITNANFSSATRYPTSTPKSPGSAESITVSGLSSDTDYFFAIKASDEVPNWSAISNTVSGRTQAGGPTTSWNGQPDTDTFDGDLSNWNASTYHYINNSELALRNLPATLAWYMAVYKKRVGANGASFTLSPNAGTGPYSYIPLGLAIVLDGPTTAANGWLILKYEKVYAYEIATGSKSATAYNSWNGTQPNPGPDGVMKAEIVELAGGEKQVTVYINGTRDVTFNLPAKLPTSQVQTSLVNAYAGIVQFGSSDSYNPPELNAISSYTAYYSGAAGAEKIEKIEPAVTTGPINQLLGDSLRVRVLNEEDAPAEGVVVNFAVTQGTASLTIDEMQFNGQVWSEVEGMAAKSYIVPGTPATRVEDPNASGDAYVMGPTISGWRGKKLVNVPIYLPVTGSYNVWLRMYAPNSDADNVYVKVDNFDSLYISANALGSWIWQKVDSRTLEKGFHNFYIIHYSGDMRWDKVLFVNTPGYTPTGKGGESQVFPNVTNADGIAKTGVRFGTNADSNVVVEATGYKADNVTLLDGAPIQFVLDPTPGPADSLKKDPSLPDPIFGTRDPVVGATLVALVKDSYGNRVPNTAVAWRILAGQGAQLANSSTISDFDGKATNTMVLGHIDSIFTVEASGKNALNQPLKGSPVVFTIKAGELPTTMEYVGGNGQDGNAGDVLVQPLKVRLLGKGDGPLANFPVEFAVTQGGGKVSPESPIDPQAVQRVNTNVAGEAWVYWTLGNVAGTNTVEARLPGLETIPKIIFTAVGNTGPASIFEIASGNNQTGPIGFPLRDSLVVKVTDRVGNPIAGRQINFDVIDGTDAYFDTPGLRTKTRYTNGAGRAAVLLIMGREVNEVNRVRATAPGTPALTPENLTFEVTATEAVAKSIVYVAGNAQDTTVTFRLSKPFEIQVYGPYNSIIANHPVKFRVVKGGGNFDGLSEKTVTSDANGIARATLTLGKVAGDSSNVIEVIAYRIDLPTVHLEGSPIRLWANGEPGPAAKLVKDITTDNQSGAAGAVLPKDIRAGVTDVHGNPIRNYPVTFQVEGAGGTFIDNTGESTVKVEQTGSDGYAVVKWKMPTLLGEWRIRVDALRGDGAPLTDSPSYFTATSVTGDAYRMVKWNTPDTLVGTVDKVLPRKVRIRITDRNELPKGGYPVTFTVTQGNGTVNGKTFITIPTSADSGIADVSWTIGTVAGIANNVMEVRAGVVEQSLLVFKATGLPDIPYQVSADPASNNQLGTVGTVLPKPVKIQVKDKYGNGVADVPVTFHVTGVDSLKGNIDGEIEKIVNTGIDGWAQVVWTLGKRPGTKNNSLEASARYNGIHLNSSPYIFYASTVVDVPSLLLMESDTSKLKGTIGNALAEQLKVRVTDRFRNPIANHEVVFEVMSRDVAGGGSLDGTADFIKTKRTDSNGITFVTFTCGTVAGNKNNRVEARALHSGVNLTGSPAVFLISAQFSIADRIESYDGNNQTGTVGKFLEKQLAVRAHDRFGNPVKDQPIQFRIIVGSADKASLSADSLLLKVVNTGSDGIARVPWRLGQKAGTDRNVVEATSTNGAIPLTNSPVRFTAIATPDVTDGKRSSILAVDASVNADGVAKAAIKVTLHDKYDNPVSARYVTLLATDLSCIITQPYTTTDVNGDAIGYVASTKAGYKWIKARDVNSMVDISDSVRVYFKPLPAYEIFRASVHDGDSQTRNVGTALPMPLRVVVRDQFGNPIPNHPVSFVPTQGGGEMLDPQVIYTDSSGHAQSRYKLGPSPGVNFVEARGNKTTGDPLYNSPVRFTEIGLQPQPSKLVIVGGDTQKVAPGQQLPEVLKVRLVDVMDWPIAGVEVKFNVLVNNGAITSTNPVKTNMFGESAVQAIGGTAVGSNFFSAFLPSYSAIGAVTFTATTYIPPTSARKLVYVSGSDQRGTVGRTLFNPLCVRAEDDYGNPVPNVNVTFSVMEDASTRGRGTLEGGKQTLSILSNGQGIACVTYTLGTNAGLNKIRASAVNLQPLYIEYAVYGDADYPYCMEKVDNPNLRGQVGKRMIHPIQALVRDQYGNPARGGMVSFVVIPGNGHIDGSSLITSDANGLASAYWVLGKQGTNEAIATASMPCGTPTIRYYAIGELNNYPELSLSEEYVIRENELLCFPVTATDEDGDQIFYSAKNMPEGATFEPDPYGVYRFCWAPDYTQGDKVYHPVFTAQDNKGGIGIDSVKITVTNQNRAPQITYSEPVGEFVIMNWGQSMNFSVIAEDEDNDQLFYNWKIGENNVGSSATFTLDSRYYLLGSYVVVVEVYDQEYKVNRIWYVGITSVEMKSFTCSATPYDGVTLQWQTANEHDNLGFNVLRSRTEDGSYEKINEKIVPARSDGDYHFVDRNVVSGLRYYYKVEDVNSRGQTTVHGPVMAEVPVPTSFELSQNYPNPFNPTTTLRYQIPSASRVRVDVFNTRGQLIRTLVDADVQAGFHTIVWDGRNQSGTPVVSGVYYYRMVTEGFTMTRKMALLK
ncbi:Ig-like domain-containing protein [candidate division KSB1 bacterium]|nr:Ig-like domain-containing protein [candidate division KSB1 bacterium]